MKLQECLSQCNNTIAADVVIKLINMFISCAFVVISNFRNYSDLEISPVTVRYLDEWIYTDHKKYYLANVSYNHSNILSLNRITAHA